MVLSCFHELYSNSKLGLFTVDAVKRNERRHGSEYVSKQPTVGQPLPIRSSIISPFPSTPLLSPLPSRSPRTVLSLSLSSLSLSFSYSISFSPHRFLSLPLAEYFIISLFLTVLSPYLPISGGTSSQLIMGYLMLQVIRLSLAA